MLLWGTFLRTTLGLHATWLVNSATHLLGASAVSRPKTTPAIAGGSLCSPVVKAGITTTTRIPVSARHGLTWYEFDVNYYCIWVLSKLGLAEKVQVAKFDPKNPKPAGA